MMRNLIDQDFGDRSLEFISEFEQHEQSRRNPVYGFVTYLKQQGFLPTEHFVQRFLQRLHSQGIRVDPRTFVQEFLSTKHYRQTRPGYNTRLAIVRSIPIVYRSGGENGNRIVLVTVLPEGAPLPPTASVSPPKQRMMELNIEAELEQLLHLPLLFSRKKQLELDVDRPLSEEEFRRHNRTFRKQMAKTIGDTPKHPLKFLIKQGKGGQWIWRTAKDRRIDAGHVTPVTTLEKRGHTTERLAIQDRTLNRSDGGKMAATGKGKTIKVIDIAGVPVDVETAKKYVKMGLLDASVVDKADAHPGWKGDGEFSFCMGEFHDWVSRSI
jgi:hypothetical protein